MGFTEEILEIIDDTELMQTVRCLEGKADLYLDYPDLYQKLYRHYTNGPCQMPYGTAKARNGDPDRWILATIESGLISDGWGWTRDWKSFKRKLKGVMPSG